MRRVTRSALVTHTANQMFDVVNDVNRYAEFLPWCVDSVVLEDVNNIMVAQLVIARGGLKRSFTTKNTHHMPDRIQMELVKGPFSKLFGLWQFTQLGGDGCRIEMDLSFDFDNRMMNMTLASVFNVAADTMVDAFCKRADELYA
ncbi:MAG: type II toxin-antitoxin system RatA family toxin [Pseudomonadales bacterium]|nr:type II toxin-antitoxin system RatA family toxin [Pseudomonadales bacterium]